MTPGERTARLGVCLAEVKSLRKTAEALHMALTMGDTVGVRVLADAQELHIWRIGRILSASAEAMPVEPGGAERVAFHDREAVEDSLRQEMVGLADLARMNARLLEDGITVSRTLLRMLMTRTGDSGVPGWNEEDSRARMFNRQV